MTPRLKNIGVGCFVASIAGVALAQTVARPSRSVTDPGVITTRQTITPAGVQTVFDGRVYGLTFGATGDELWVLAGARGGRPNVYRLDWRENVVKGRWQLQGTAALQGLVLDPATQTPLVGVTVPPRAAGNRPGGAVQLLRYARLGADRPPDFVPLAADLGRHLAGAPSLARHDSRGRAILPLIFDDALAVIDAATGSAGTPIKTNGVAPFGSAISRDGRIAWVSNWGGRWPKDGDPTLPTGLEPDADRVVVDSRGIASTGTVVRIDLDRRVVTDSIDVGLHPTAIAWDEPRQRLYVANANNDSLSIVDTANPQVVATMPMQPFGLALKGVAPSAIAIARDGRRVYVALGGLNAVAVVDTEQRAVRGYIPTAWYPNHVAMSTDGSKLAVATLLGVGSGWQEAPARRYVHAYRGTVSVFPVPDDQQLASYTTAVAENNHIANAREQLAPSSAGAAPTALPVTPTRACSRRSS